ncbi:MAG: hypothetical protein AMXMBFR84_15100 [Candidatus Hydrogenedentota bacterium]
MIRTIAWPMIATLTVLAASGQELITGPASDPPEELLVLARESKAIYDSITSFRAHVTKVTRTGGASAQSPTQPVNERIDRVEAEMGFKDGWYRLIRNWTTETKNPDTTSFQKITVLLTDSFFFQSLEGNEQHPVKTSRQYFELASKDALAPNQDMYIKQMWKPDPRIFGYTIGDGTLLIDYIEKMSDYPGAVWSLRKSEGVYYATIHFDGDVQNGRHRSSFEIDAERDFFIQKAESTNREGVVGSSRTIEPQQVDGLWFVSLVQSKLVDLESEVTYTNVEINPEFDVDYFTLRSFAFKESDTMNSYSQDRSRKTEMVYWGGKWISIDQLRENSIPKK